MSINPTLYDEMVLTSLVENGIMNQAQLIAYVAPGLRIGLENTKTLIVQDIERCFYPLMGMYSELDETIEDFEKKIRTLECRL